MGSTRRKSVRERERDGKVAEAQHRPKRWLLGERASPTVHTVDVERKPLVRDSQPHSERKKKEKTQAERQMKRRKAAAAVE